jgi:hypothetical protein
MNMDVFKELNGVYVLSRAKISNADALGLAHVGTYDDPVGIYTIFAYAVR